MRDRKLLSDILHGENRDDLFQTWNETEAADDVAPLPAGEYTARITSGDLFTSQRGTPGYKLTFRVCEGPHAGRQFWHDSWLTGAALPMTKRDLGKLGVTSLEQLERPLPPGIRCRCKLTLRRDDDGNSWNSVKRFDVVGIDKPQADPFAPDDAAAEVIDALAASAGEGDSSFDVAQLQAELDAEANAEAADA